MREDVHDAIEAARLVKGDGYNRVGQTRRRESFEATRAELLRLIRDLPDDMTIAELRQEIE